MVKKQQKPEPRMLSIRGVSEEVHLVLEREGTKNFRTKSAQAKKILTEWAEQQKGE